MDPSLLSVILFLAAQTVVIAGAVIGAYVGLSTKLREVSVHVHHLTNNRDADAAAHVALRDQVHGLSRTVERHDTVIQLQTVRSARRAEDLAQASAGIAPRDTGR